MTPSELAAAETTIAAIDPQLGILIATQRPLAPRQRTGYFESLCRSIIGQQVSVAAASAIFGRFAAATELAPNRVEAIDEAGAKAIGLSRQKLSYLRDLAAHFVRQPDIFAHLEHGSDDAVIAELTAVKGIGVWTAQMFLMFTLGRPDVFAPDDVGLQQGMKQLYGWGALPPKKELALFAERWRPYRTVASFHLWESLKNTPSA
jgi:DNA-3-methyladenine glycosylase II